MVVRDRMPMLPVTALGEAPGGLLARGFLGSLASLSHTADLLADHPDSSMATAAAAAAAAAQAPSAPPAELVAEWGRAAQRAARTGMVLRSEDRTRVHFGPFQVAACSGAVNCAVDAGLVWKLVMSEQTWGSCTTKSLIMSARFIAPQAPYWLRENI